MPIGRQFIQIQVHTWYEGEPGQDGGPNKKRVVNETYALPEIIDKLPDHINRLADRITGSLLRGWPSNDAEMMASIQIAPTDNAQVTIAIDQQQSLESAIILEPDFTPQATESGIDENVIIYSDVESKPEDSTPSVDPQMESAENQTECVAEREPTLPKQPRELATRPDIYVLLREEALARARNHADEDRSRETGGVLLGRSMSQDGRLIVVVTGIVRALRAVGRAASVEFTPEAWAEVWRKIDADPGYKDEKKWTVIGWYHTHPRFGIFMSSMDLSIHRGHFAQPGHIALVIDPVHGDWGVFGWDRERKQVLRCSEDQLKVLSDRVLFERLSNALDRSVTVLPLAEIGGVSHPTAQTEGQYQSLEEVGTAKELIKEPTPSGSGIREKAKVTEETENTVNTADSAENTIPPSSGKPE